MPKLNENKCEQMHVQFKEAKYILFNGREIRFKFNFKLHVHKHSIIHDSIQIYKYNVR